MTYYNPGSYSAPKAYKFTALKLSDLQDGGLQGSVNCGDTFTMGASASLCITVKDDDRYLSGDGRWCYNDKATDQSYQKGKITKGENGPEIGNGGQLYIEKYFWVSDQNGKWYVMLEIEQEGSDANYYTFHSSYGVPPEGAQLKVGSSCDVSGSGIKYENLGAGDCAPPPPPPDCIVVEAEDMQLYGYKTEYLAGASEGKVIKAGCDVSWAKTTFKGEAGKYDLKLSVVDENDGQGYIKIYINGKLKKSVKLDEDSGGAYGETGVFREIVLDDVMLNVGDKIVIKGVRNCNEFARIDKLEICKDDEPQPAALGDTVFYDTDKDGIQDAGEAGVQGVTVNLKDAGGAIIATTLTDANGKYLFDNLAPGTYSVGFVIPAGFVGSPQDQGGDDGIDSDGNSSTGMTGPYTLAAGETNLSVDMGIYQENNAPEPEDDRAAVCATETVNIDVVANDSDPDGDPIEVAHINGVAVATGESVTLASGAVVTLLADGSLDYDSSNASYMVDGVLTPADEMLIRTEVSENFSYSISDGEDIGSAYVNVKVCGAKNTLETIEASLPASGMAVLSVDNADFFTIEISGTGDANFNGSYDIAYCIAAEVPITPGTSYQVEFCVLDKDISTDYIANPENVGYINWILNQDFTSVSNGEGGFYTEGEIQGAIWGFSDGFSFIDDVPDSFGSDENSIEIYQAALDAGLAAQNYVPGEGDIVSILLKTENPHQVQPLIIGIEFDELAQECTCDNFVF
ncbi:SdrD B-like domain-containing protein [Sulfitobacter aestuarii]|uniref:SdrD B-like domain-containing protein n=1 Tax=Sulfitobacter aestuarii TaxID=2161676 RepID=A0ABW5U813_9RHOB